MFQNIKMSKTRLTIGKKLLNTINANVKFYSTKRKYPPNPEEAAKLPIFDYSVSKESYNRLFVWGSASTGALGLAYKNKDISQISEIKRPKRSGFGERYEVTSVACGFGFTVFGVNSADAKVYGTGLNTDSQMGCHEVRSGNPLEVLFLPQPIHLPFMDSSKAKVKKISAGRTHLIILTNEGMFILGNNAYGQCGRSIIPDEKYSGSKFIDHIKNIDGKSVVDVQCGQDHSLAITEDGCVYSCGWGADGQTGLGHYKCETQFTRVLGDISTEKIIKLACRSDFVLALSDKGDVFGWGNTEYSQLSSKGDLQQVCSPTHVMMCQPLGRIKDVASGGSFCAVVNEEGCVYTWGYGLIGVGPRVHHSKTPVKIPSVLFGINDFQPDTRVVSVACGVSHMCAVTNYGDLYTWGRNRNCCLGLSDEKDQPFPLKVALAGFVKTVECGVDHTVALCKPFI